MSDLIFIRYRVNLLVDENDDFKSIVDMVDLIEREQELYITKLHDDTYKFHEFIEREELIQPSDIRFELLDKILTSIKNCSQRFKRNRISIRMTYLNDLNEFVFRYIRIHHYRRNKYSIQFENG